MICRIYDTKEKRYIKADESMDYMIHPVGAVFHMGAEDHTLITEMSTQRTDMNGKEMFAGDVVKNHTILSEYKGRDYNVYEAPIEWNSKKLRFEIGGKPLNGKKLEVVGTIHDEEMEAE